MELTGGGASVSASPTGATCGSGGGLALGMLGGARFFSDGGGIGTGGSLEAPGVDGGFAATGAECFPELGAEGNGGSFVALTGGAARWLDGGRGLDGRGAEASGRAVMGAPNKGDEWSATVGPSST